jgi:hypothetical protein
VIIPPFLGRERALQKHDQNDGDVAKPKKKKKRSGGRCRKCGHEVWEGAEYYDQHPERGTPGADYKQPADVCRVPVDKREPGFPVPPNQSLPRKSRAKRNLEKFVSL